MADSTKVPTKAATKVRNRSWWDGRRA